MTDGPLLVVVADRPSALVRKGEYTPRYYNPGDLFREIHLLLTTDDDVTPEALQEAAGRARIFVHRLPAGRGLFVRTLGWRPARLEGWAGNAVELARQIRPSLVRCHENHLNAFLASRIKRALGVPYVVSLHGNPDVDGLRGRLARRWSERVAGRAIAAVETLGVREADHVIAVYRPIVPYLEKRGVERYSVLYNVVGRHRRAKTGYALGGRRLKAICVGRQQSLQKNPRPIVEAVLEMPEVSLLLVGEGDLHEELVARVEAAHASSRIRFARSIPDHRLLEEMASSDVFVYSSMNYEISKGSMEAALAGLPVVVNDRGGEPAPELVGGHFLLVEGSAESYRRALTRLMEDPVLRESLGRAARRYAEEHWDPDETEARLVELYRRVMAEAWGGSRPESVGV